MTLIIPFLSNQAISLLIVIIFYIFVIACETHPYHMYPSLKNLGSGNETESIQKSQIARGINRQRRERPVVNPRTTCGVTAAPATAAGGERAGVIVIGRGTYAVWSLWVYIYGVEVLMMSRGRRGKAGAPRTSAYRWRGARTMRSFNAL